MDLPAEFFLQTVQSAFQEHALPDGTMTHRGEKVDCGAIRDTALMTVEGEKDDICGLGQTEAAHDLCTDLPPQMRYHYVQPGVGHYGVFNGTALADRDPAAHPRDDPHHPVPQTHRRARLTRHRVRRSRHRHGTDLRDRPAPLGQGATRVRRMPPWT